MARFALPVRSYKHRATQASPSRIVNCIPESLPPDAKTPMVLVRLPGIASFATPGNGPIRGMHAAFGDLFVVSGTGLYRVDSSGTETLIGSIPGVGSVCMAHNRAAIVVVAQPNAYWSDGVSGVTQITDADFTSRGAKYVRFLDNYMLFMEPNTDRFFGAEVGTVDDFDALDFASAEGSPDDLVGFEVDHRQAVLLGEESGELYENTGVAGFPFERAINGFFEVGCFNGDTIVKLDNSVVWVANDYTVRRLQGVTPQRISTHAVEQFLTGVDVSTLRAFSYSQDGHFFYVLTCSTGCWAYDVTSNEWAERETYPNAYYEWQYQASAHGRQYVGNAYSNAVGYFDAETYTENGGIQRMEWTYQPIYADGRLAFHDRFEVVLEYGVGLVTGQGSDPEIMLSYSDDGGKTWRNLPNRSFGRMGEYRRTVSWVGLGSSRMRVYRCAISDPVHVAVTDTQVEVRGGRL